MDDDYIDLWNEIQITRIVLLKKEIQATQKMNMYLFIILHCSSRTSNLHKPQGCEEHLSTEWHQQEHQFPPSNEQKSRSFELQPSHSSKAEDITRSNQASL